MRGRSFIVTWQMEKEAFMILSFLAISRLFIICMGGTIMNQHFYTVFILTALFLFIIFKRVRGNIGWQQMNQRNLLVRTLFLYFFGLVFLGEGVFHPIGFISDIFGILIGIILAYYSAVITRFEQRNGRWFYRPNIWIGSAVTVIFLARFIYRLYGIVSSGTLGDWKEEQSAGWQNIAFASGNSWTSGSMLIMFAYYFIYYTILRRKQKLLLQTEKNLPANSAEGEA